MTKNYDHEKEMEANSALTEALNAMHAPVPIATQAAFPAGIGDGLTKLELISAMAMQGMLSSEWATGDHQKLAPESRNYARALLAELEKEG